MLILIIIHYLRVITLDLKDPPWILPCHYSAIWPTPGLVRHNSEDVPEPYKYAFPFLPFLPSSCISNCNMIFVSAQHREWYSVLTPSGFLAIFVTWSSPTVTSPNLAASPCQAPILSFAHNTYPGHSPSSLFLLNDLTALHIGTHGSSSLCHPQNIDRASNYTAVCQRHVSPKKMVCLTLSSISFVFLHNLQQSWGGSIIPKNCCNCS